MLSLSSRRGASTPASVSTFLGAAFDNLTLQQYVPTGTLITAGFYSEVDLDLSAFTAFGGIAGVVTVNGAVIGTIPETVVSDITDLIVAIQTAVSTGGTNFTVTDNGDDTITFSSTVSGTNFNGAIVDIQINPTFEKLYEVSYDARDWRQPIQINDPASANYRNTLIASRQAAGNFIIEVLYQQAAHETIAVGLPIGTYAVAHNPVTDEVVTGAFSSSNSVLTLNNIWVQQTTTLVNAGVGWAVFNSQNNCYYFAATVANRTIKLDPTTGTVTAINSTTGVFKLAVDELNGNIWAVGPANIYIINMTTNVITTTISTAGLGSNSITYYPGDGTPGTERMFVAMVTSGVIRSYNLDGTVDAATWYTMAGVGALIYSQAYNMIFAADGGNVRVIKMDASLRDSIVAAVDNFVEDIPGGLVIGADSTNTLSTAYVRYIGMTDDGIESYSGTLAGGTPDVYQTDDDQCIAEDDMRVFIEKLKRDCGCSDCVTSTPTAVTPPPSATYVIYYGNSDDSALNASGIAALTGVSQSGYSGTYSFAATSPSEWKYLAWPTSLGSPTNIYDPSTGFPISFDTYYSVVINLIPYTVARTYYELGGAISFTVV